jgi:LysR family transcriptional regulator, transcriptional activator for leuABCD operon
MLNLRSVDLNLLPVFEAAYEERNLSRAAERLAMTQSAVSHAVTRLRAVFRDELFIPQARGMLPTPAADMVYARLRGALTSVRESVAEMRGFDPKSSERQFFISIPHPLGPLIAVRLRERLAQTAPGISVAFSTRSRPVELERGMREGRVDAAVDWLVPAGPKFNEVTLFEDSIVAVARHGHPALRRPASLKTLKDGTFVTLRPREEGENPVAGLQEWSRLGLNSTLEVSESLEVLMVAAESDLFGLIPRSMMKIAHGTFGLRALQAGPKAASVPVKLVWHASRDADPANAFLRKQVVLSSKDVAPRRPQR